MTNLHISLDAPTLDSLFGSGVDAFHLQQAPSNAGTPAGASSSAADNANPPGAQDQAAAARFQSQIQNLDAAAGALQETASATAVTQSALTTLQMIARNIQALSTQAAAPTATPQSNALLQTQITQLVSEFNAVGVNTQFNGVHLFSSGNTTTTPQIVQSADAGFDSGSAVGNPTSVTATFTNALTPGNLVVAVFSHGDGYNGGGGAGIITAPPGFTLVQNTDNGFNTGIAVYTHVVTASDGGSYTFTLSNSVPGNTETAALLEISGADETTPVAAAAGTYQDIVSSDAPLTTASLSAPDAHDLAIVGFTPNVDYGTETTSANLNVVGGYSQLYNDSTVATASSTAAGQAIQGSYSNSATTNGASILLLLHPQSASSTNVISAPVTPGNADIAVGTIPVINANFSGLSAINVVTSASDAQTLSTNVLNTLSTLQTAVGATERTIAASLENIDTTLVGVTATYASTLARNTSPPASVAANSAQEGALQSAFGRAYIAQANIPNGSVLALFLARNASDAGTSQS